MNFAKLSMWYGRVPPIDIHQSESDSCSEFSSYTDESSLSSSPDMSYRDPMPILDREDEIPDHQGSRKSPDKKSKLPVISLNDIFYHDSYEDCWVVIYDKVYDITSFLLEHPGGEDVMMEYAGRDATIAFSGVGHSRGAIKALEQYLVGILPVEERVYPTDEQDKDEEQDSRWHYSM